MSEITLGGNVYPVGPYTMAEVQRMLPQFAKHDVVTVEGAAATGTIIVVALGSAGSKISAVDAQNILGVTMQEMTAAVVKIGLQIGAYVPKTDTPATGESAGAASP